MTRSILAFVLSAILVLAGCGGGGSTPANNSNNLSPSEQAQRILENCVVPDLQELGGIFELLQGLADPDGLPDDLTFQFNLSGVVSWQLPVDVDGDGTFDTTLSGSITFLDDQGDPASPPIDLLNLPSSFEEFLDLIDAGEGLRITYDMTPIGGASFAGSGQVTVVFAATGIDVLSGAGEIQSAGCIFRYDFNGVELADLLEEYAVVTIEFTLDVDGEISNGTLELDGTSVATATLNGLTFEIDLSAPQPTVTPVP